MNKSILIHNNNIKLNKNTETMKYLSFGLDRNENNKDVLNSDTDRYMTKFILEDIRNEGEFNLIFIKDRLSNNYLDLYGLLLAYHIRFTEDMKYIPIIIISDLDSHTLNLMTPLARILFTRNIFLIANSPDEINKMQQLTYIKSLTKDNFKIDFLNLIKVDAPASYVSRHSIANEWAIYKWAKELKISDSKNINEIIEELSQQLYFKYLQNKYSMTDNIVEIEKEKKLLFKGKPLQIVKKAKVEKKRILYIDDEWNKGWNDIFKTIFTEQKGYKFEAIEDILYKDKDYNDIKTKIIDKIERYKPDLIILDMRLVDSDHKKKENSKNISGIKILEAIKSEKIKNNINPAIQVIMLTASGRSDILDNANKDNKILGYIKKEHPEDIYSDTKESIEKFKKLVDKGFEKSYLKEIWDIQNTILKLDLSNEIKFEVKSVFEILDSDMEKRYTYAMLSIFQSLEEINNIYINDKTKKWIDGYVNIVVEDNGYTKQKIEAVLKRLDLFQEFTSEIYIISKMRKNAIHPPKKSKYDKPTKENILTWFKMLQIILEKVSSDKPNH